MTDLQSTEPSITRLVQSGYSSVLSVRLTSLGPNVTSWYDMNKRVVRAVFVAAFWPLALELLLLIALPGFALHTLRAVLWVIAFAVMNMVGLSCSGHCWRLLERAAPSLDELVAPSAGRQGIANWFARASTSGWQVLSSVIFSILACLALRLIAPSIKGELEIGLLSYVSVGWTAAIFGNCVYWLVIVPELARRILRLPDLNWVWHSPASTPGVAQLSSVFGFSTIMALVVAVGAQLLALHASRYGDSGVLSASSTIFPIAGGMLALIVGILPHWWLYLAVRDARRAALRKLRGLTGRMTPESAQDAQAVQSHVELYRLVESSQGLPFTTTAMVQYGAAILGTMLAFFLGR